MSDFIEQVKARQGYSEQVKNCGNCKFKVAEPGSDGWGSACGYSRICVFTVKDTAVCKNWELKPTDKPAA